MLKPLLPSQSGISTHRRSRPSTAKAIRTTAMVIEIGEELRRHPFLIVLSGADRLDIGICPAEHSAQMAPSYSRCTAVTSAIRARRVFEPTMPGRASARQEFTT